MAKAVFNLQKESGGIVKISPVDGTGITEVTVPESGNLVSVDTAVTDNAIARYDGATGKLQNSSVTIDDNGNIGSGTQTFNGFGGSGFKNYIINGNFDIDQYQRGAQSNWNSANCYIDRFIVANSNVVRNGAGANNPIGTGLHNHLSITKTAGADTQIIQRWEIPKDKAKQFLNGRTLTFSCLVLAATANFVEHLFFIKNGASANSYEVTTFNITKNNEAAIWTRVTGTITNIQWTYEAGEYIEIRLDPVNGLAGTLHTTGWQLEEGSIATPFEQRPIGLELSLCQRYFRSGNAGPTGQGEGGAANFMGAVFSGSEYGVTIPFDTEMRIDPTIIATDSYNQNFPAGSTAINSSRKGITIRKTANSTANSGRFVVSWTASAEL